MPSRLRACALVAPGFALGAGDPTGDDATGERCSRRRWNPWTRAFGARRDAVVFAALEPSNAERTTTPTAEETTALDEEVATATPQPQPRTQQPPCLLAVTLLVTLPWGSGPGQVGLLDPGEGLARGPEALAAAPNGRIAVLDSVNSRLLFLDPSGEPVGTAFIPLASPRFLAVDDSRLYVLDCDADHRLVSFDWSGTAMGTTDLPELEDVVTGLFATDQGPCIEIAHETVLLLAQTAQTFEASAARSRPVRATTRTVAGRPLDRSLGRSAQVTFSPRGPVRVKFFQVDPGSLQAVQTNESSPVLAAGRAIEHLVSVDGDGAGGLIIGARLLRPEVAEGRNAFLALTRLPSAGDSGRAGDGNGGGLEAAGDPMTGSTGAKDDAMTDTILLADSPLAYLGQPYVVAPDGRVLQPWGDESGYSILIHSFAGAVEVQP